MKLGNNLKVIRKFYKKSQEEVASDLGLTRSSYSGYENGIAEPSIETLLGVSNYYSIPIDSLITKDFEQFSESDWASVASGLYADINGSKLRVLTAVVDQSEEELIEMIPQKARAGYTSGYADPDYLKVLPTFTLPFLSRDRKYRSFPIIGDSMPPVEEGSFVVAEYIQNWATIRNNTPCIVVTKEDGIVFKLVNNYLDKNQSFELCSTNPIYLPYQVHVNEIIEIWKFVNYISPQLPEMRIDDSQLTKSIQDLQREVMELKSAVLKK
ncbi:MAG TPA: helix-turn-helix domain-containing protein [Fluviicola sp.]|nr:helix-turn-helix domain-containing protein [Fluviicola sp.]